MVKARKWKTGVVESLVTGNDKEVRGANVHMIVKYKRKILNRPMQKLYALEIHVATEVNTKSTATSAPEAVSAQVRRNPQRHTAVNARDRIRTLAKDSVVDS